MNAPHTSRRRTRRSKATPAKRLAITYLPTDSLIPNPRNPRRHSAAQIAKLARIIGEVGFNNIIVADEGNQIIVGHARWEAAKLRRMRELPVIRLSHLTPEQQLAYMLADNKLTDESDFDEHKVALILKELTDVVVDFDLELTGFDPPEIDLLIQTLEAPEEVADAADDFETISRPPVSRLGDLWQLDTHRLLCGSALESASYGILLAGEKAAATFTDPPYNVRIKGHVSGAGKKTHREFVEASGEKSEEEFTEFLLTAINLMIANSIAGATFFVCMDWRHLRPILDAIEDAGGQLLNVCVWVKTNGGMGSLYRSRHEFVFVFNNRGARSVNNVQLGKFGRNRTNVWNYAGMNSFARRGRRRALDLHPTVKPIGLVADAILDVTTLNDVVLDPFCGSGTTILAAERKGRRCYAIELDPAYVDVAIARWERMTGKHAIHASGKTFAEIRAERGGEEAVS